MHKRKAIEDNNIPFERGFKLPTEVFLNSRSKQLTRLRMLK